MTELMLPVSVWSCVWRSMGHRLCVVGPAGRVTSRTRSYAQYRDLLRLGGRDHSGESCISGGLCKKCPNGYPLPGGETGRGNQRNEDFCWLGDPDDFTESAADEEEAEAVP